MPASFFIFVLIIISICHFFKRRLAEFHTIIFSRCFLHTRWRAKIGRSSAFSASIPSARARVGWRAAAASRLLLADLGSHDRRLTAPQPADDARTTRFLRFRVDTKLPAREPASTTSHGLTLTLASAFIFLRSLHITPLLLSRSWHTTPGHYFAGASPISGFY